MNEEQFKRSLEMSTVSLFRKFDDRAFPASLSANPAMFDFNENDSQDQHASASSSNTTGASNADGATNVNANANGGNGATSNTGSSISSDEVDNEIGSSAQAPATQQRAIRAERGILGPRMHFKNISNASAASAASTTGSTTSSQSQSQAQETRIVSSASAPDLAVMAGQNDADAKEDLVTASSQSDLQVTRSGGEIEAGASENAKAEKKGKELAEVKIKNRASKKSKGQGTSLSVADDGTSSRLPATSSQVSSKRHVPNHPVHSRNSLAPNSAVVTNRKPTATSNSISMSSRQRTVDSEGNIVIVPQSYKQLHYQKPPAPSSLAVAAQQQPRGDHSNVDAPPVIHLNARNATSTIRPPQFKPSPETINLSRAHGASSTATGATGSGDTPQRTRTFSAEDKRSRHALEGKTRIISHDDLTAVALNVAPLDVKMVKEQHQRHRDGKDVVKAVRKPLTSAANRRDRDKEMQARSKSDIQLNHKSSYEEDENAE